MSAGGSGDGRDAAGGPSDFVSALDSALPTAMLVHLQVLSVTRLGQDRKARVLSYNTNYKYNAVH